MKPRLNLTPAQLVFVSLSGFAISAGSLVLVRFSHAIGGTRWISALLTFGIFVLGMVVSLKANDNLKNGIANCQWPEERIQPLRSHLESPFYNAFLILLLVTYGVLWLIYFKYRAIGLAGFLLMQTLSQLRTAVRRPPAKPSSLIAGWRDLSPIHSDQWGRR